jgi:hypothetical protein
MLSKFYNAQATIYRLDSTQDKFGGTTNEWEKKDWVVPCRIWGYRGELRIDISGKSYGVAMQMACDSETDIKIEDKVVIKDDKFMVVGIVPRQTEQEKHHLSILLTRLDE